MTDPTYTHENLITQEDILECLTYCPDTGIFTWNKRPRSHFKTDSGMKRSNLRYSGKETGCKNRDGYLIITISNRQYYLHRVAFLYMQGVWPRDQIDHEDHNRANNKWKNLRESTNQENCRNRTLGKKNNSGCYGVSWSKRDTIWRAMIGEKYLGNFTDIDDAIAARKSAEVELGFHPNHGR